MNSDNEKKNLLGHKRIIRSMGIVIIILVVITAALAMQLLGNKDKKSGVKSETTSETTSEIEPLYADDIEATEIKTPYCNLYFPKQWESNLKIVKKTGKKGDTVQFWATIKGKEKIHLFDVVFNGDGYEIGVIKGKEEISVAINSYDIELDDSWTDEEKEIIYTMSEDINYLLIEMKKIEGFVEK